MHPLIWLRNVFRSALERSLIGRALQEALTRPPVGIIHIISATRMNEENFWKKSALGQSLVPYQNDKSIAPHIHFENATGLSEIYNQYIHRKWKKDILLFIHDDVWFDSETWPQEIRKGLARFDIVGVAGNTRLTSKHPAWLFSALTPQGFVWDSAYLSGAVGHGKNVHGKIQNYGHVPQPCKALDGVLLAARCSSLLRGNARFDTRFQFHFYDLDFSRTVNRAGLRMATWNIPITHQSAGNFGSPTWQTGYAQYLEKWNSNPPERLKPADNGL